MDDPANITTSPEAVNEESPRRFRVLPWLLFLLLLVAAGIAWWWFALRQNPESGQTTNQGPVVDQRLDDLQQAVAQLKDRDQTLRSRLNDGEQVDKSVRAQMLTMNQRLQTLEDSVGNLADKRLSGHDAVVLDEAELLLTLGAERFTLFHDVPATIAAYRAADSALSQIDDAAFLTVRETIAAEIAALNDLRASDPASIGSRLAALRAEVAGLPAPRSTATTKAETTSTSPLWRVLGALVQVHHDDDAHKQFFLRDVGLVRRLVVLDLRDAGAAALAHDDSRYRDAIADARTQLTASFAGDDPAVQSTLKQLDALHGATLAPPAPQLFGASLKELRNLRATHALRAPSALPSKAVLPRPTEQPQPAAATQKHSGLSP
ncbi:MAG: uroporphyrinogen-III C-methyltransferase [Rudaea sp.]